jgi:hypothetical protein
LPGRDISAVLSTILCAARTGDTIGAKWSEIDQKEKHWRAESKR